MVTKLDHTFMYVLRPLLQTDCINLENTLKSNTQNTMLLSDIPHSALMNRVIGSYDNIILSNVRLCGHISEFNNSHLVDYIADRYKSGEHGSGLWVEKDNKLSTVFLDDVAAVKRILSLLGGYEYFAILRLFKHE